LFKFYKHLKYSEINEDGETTYFPLEEVKEIDEVDPVNQVALKSNYTNVNISNVSRKLKKRIVNSVLNHSKRAKQIIEEWQSEREKENTKDEEEVDKESHSRIPFSIIKERKLNNEDIEEKSEDDCPLLISGEKGTAFHNNNIINSNNDVSMVNMNENNQKHAFNQKNKNRSKVFKKKHHENDNNFVETIGEAQNFFAENLEVETIKKFEQEDSANLLPSKRKTIQNIGKSSTKKHKPLENQIHKINKKVSFNMRERLISSYDMQKPITLTSNKVINSLNAKPVKGVLKVSKKHSNLKSVQFM